MTVVAEFTIATEALPGGAALLEFPDVRIELERIVPAGETALPFFWVTGDHIHAFLERLREDPAIEAVDVLEEVDGTAIVRATWHPDASIIEAIRRLRATILRATGNADQWWFRVRSEDRDRLAEFRESFAAEGVTVQVERVYRFADLDAIGGPLTDEQRETLLYAYREGYFDEPRRVTQGDIADHFGISSRAVSNRLRRGTRNLVATTLADPDGDER